MYIPHFNTYYLYILLLALLKSSFHHFLYFPFCLSSMHFRLLLTSYSCHYRFIVLLYVCLIGMFYLFKIILLVNQAQVILFLSFHSFCFYAVFYFLYLLSLLLSWYICYVDNITFWFYLAKALLLLNKKKYAEGRKQNEYCGRLRGMIKLGALQISKKCSR